MRILNIIINILLCGITLLVLLAFFFSMLMRKKHTIHLNIDEISFFGDFLQYYFILALIFFISLVGFFIINKFFAHRVTNSKKFLLNFTLWYNKVNIFYKTYGIIFTYLGPGYTQYLVGLARNFLTWSDVLKRNLIIIFTVLPRIVVITIFVLEIYLGCLHYYFYALLLLLLPLLFKFIIFILKDIGPRLLPEFRNFLEFSAPQDDAMIIDTPWGKKSVLKVGLTLKREYEDVDLTSFLYYYYYPMLQIETEMIENFLPKYTKINLITLIFYWGVHVIAWRFILFKFF